MNLFSFLLTLILGNVSSYDIIDYIKDVATTNAYIEAAYKLNNFTIQDKVVLNGLEHVIKNIVEEGIHSLGRMNNMFAVPEFRLYVQWDELIETQVLLREIIQSELNIPVLHVPDESIPTPEIKSFLGFRRVLVDLGAIRREFTGIAIKNILNRTINYVKPENAIKLLHQRGLRGTDTLGNRISRALAGPEKEISLSCMCHLLAFYTCIKSPKSFITDIQFNSNGTCTLSDAITDETYGKIDGQWCQVIGNQQIKMKLYWFLISLAFVNVSSDYTKTDYTKDVFITNAHIELAYNMNNFVIKEKFVLNGLEHVIKKVIESRTYLMECLNTMLIVPEYQPSWFNWNVLRLFQKSLQNEIQSELDIPVPKIPDENYGKQENVANIINERRYLDTDTFESRISRVLAGPEKEHCLSWMCRLIALFMSTKSPESHIKYFKLNFDGSCTLKDDYECDGTYDKTYRKIKGQWCQIFGDVVQPLKELL